MKSKIILSILSLIFSLYLTAQDSKLSIDFGYGLNTYAMNNINESFIDLQSDFLKAEHIKNGQQFRLGLNYQPIGAFDIGLYGVYQYSILNSDPMMIITDDYGYPIGETRGNYKLRTEAIGTGIHATWYISDLFDFQSKENALNRFRFGIEGNGGVGFSTIISDLRYCDYPLASDEDRFTSTDFQGQIGVKAEFDITKLPIIASLGLRTGYQYFKTKTVKDRVGNEWIVDGKHPINLDFSGFYFGVYLKVGK